MVVLELHYSNCFQNIKSNFSNQVPILQRILMDTVFIHTTNRIFNLGITHIFAFIISHLNNIWVGSEYVRYSQTILTFSWNTQVCQTPHTYSGKVLSKLSLSRFQVHIKELLLKSSSNSWRGLPTWEILRVSSSQVYKTQCWV